MPTIYPEGWDSDYLDKMSIKYKYMADALKLNPVSDNWNRIIEKIISIRTGKQSTFDVESINLPPLERVINREIQSNVQHLAIPQLNTSQFNGDKQQMHPDVMQTLAGSKYKDHGYGMFGEMAGIVMHMKDSQKDYLFRLEPEQRTKLLENLKQELNKIPMIKNPKSDTIVEDIIGKRTFVNSVNLENYLDKSYQSEKKEENPDSSQFISDDNQNSSRNINSDLENELMSGGSDSGNIIIVKKE